MPLAAPKAHARIERTTVGEVTHLRLSGVIDETFSAKAVSQGLSGQVIVDLGRVQRISSFGVRQWMELSRQLPEGTLGLFVINAPPMVVDQLATVEAFAGVAKVLSFLGPYTCPNCGDEHLRLIDLRADSGAISANKAPE